MRNNKPKRWYENRNASHPPLLYLLRSSSDIIPGQVSDSESFKLNPESLNDFFISEFDAQLKFVESTADTPSHFLLIQGSNIQKGTYIDPKEKVRSPPEKSKVIGEYLSKGLDATYTVLEDHGDLKIALPSTFEKYLGFASITLEYLNGDVFKTDKLGIVEFTRNKNNMVSGFRFRDVGRLRNVLFSKEVTE